jgi:unsaturated chondroitin disaccharide hydrolase
MIKSDDGLSVRDLKSPLERFWSLSGQKIRAIEETWDPKNGTPVFTVDGKYATRGWTEWTQGFQYGSAFLQFEGSGLEEFLKIGRTGMINVMAPHVTHTGVHDHGFNNVSTYGAYRRMMLEGAIPRDEWALRFCEMALKASGAVQANRWRRLGDGKGFICSFNGPHSLFADTIRSLRSLALAHRLGHALMGEGDQKISLLQRLIAHAEATANFTVYYGEKRDAYDVKGRVAHESIFNVTDGHYRCPNSQQGFSPFSTWTRGLAWVILGFAEELEFLQILPDEEFLLFGSRGVIVKRWLTTALATADFYLENCASDGIPYWDTGAPNLHRLGDGYLNHPADPFNDFEPVDSSAAAIAAQGLLRLGMYLGPEQTGKKYYQAGLTVAKTLLNPPYISEQEDHQGLLLHSVYHRPNGWDFVPEGRKVPCSESSMWGDYHLRELALYLTRMANGKRYYTFFSPDQAK